MAPRPSSLTIVYRPNVWLMMRRIDYAAVRARISVFNRTKNKQAAKNAGGRPVFPELSAVD